MYYRSIIKTVGLYLYAFAAIQIIPLFLAAYYQFWADPATHPQPHSTGSFLFTLLFTLGLAFLCHMFGRQSQERLYRREGLAIVVLIWLLTPAISGLPFWLSGTLKNPLAAYLEGVAGLTATGTSAIESKRYDSSGHEIPIVKTVKGALNTTYTYYGTVDPVRDPVT
ncbi:MAG: TrkH family potassium uptake protein, partial [Parachlamydia sp.]|nr:TrkH family potassium uptake protein [Parachlamydia sp.]